MSISQSLTLSSLKRCGPSDELSVNRLFVSAFVRVSGMAIPHSAYLSSFIIKGDDEKYYGLLEEICRSLTIEFGDCLELEALVQLFEYVVSPADRIVTGAVYTPERIRSAIIADCLFNKTEGELRSLRVADISCGCGGFLMNVSRLIHETTGKAYADIYKENVYGIDIQPYAIERTKILLSLLALLDGEDQDFSFNLLCRDSLDLREEDWDAKFRGFDVIVGNPPYVCSRHLSLGTREKLKQFVVCGSGHPDLYIPFFQIAIELLADSGRLGYITMNTFLHSVNGRALRQYLSGNKYAIKILDFRGYQVFESRNTYTCLFSLDKSVMPGAIRYAIDEDGELSTSAKYCRIDYDDLDNSRGWALNDFETTIAFESVGMQIKDYCPSRHGIATLSNDTYIFRPKVEDESYYYVERSGEMFAVEKSICRNVINPNKLHSVEEFDSLVEKLIFPYRLVNGKITVIEPSVMADEFPQAWYYLNHRRNVLLSRDKGKTDSYPQWYAFGRTQSLKLPKYKLFFPKLANRSLKCVLRDDADLMLYNGLAFVNDDLRRLKILKEIIESELFWEYVKTNGKPYASGYYSLSGVDIKHFGIPCFSVKEEDELLSLEDKLEIENWLRRYYTGVQVDGPFRI